MSSALLPQTSRRVRRLRMRAKSETDVRRASIVLSDALHIASLPAASSGQMLVVRRLPLGRISANASAATLALLIEQAMREVRMRAVPLDSPSAKDANAILISGQAEAIAHLARLHARRETSAEWFWTTIVPAWQAGLSRGERWLALLQAAHDLPEGPLAVAMIVKEAVQARAENELLYSISPGLSRDWLHLVGWTLPQELGEAVPSLALNARHEAIVRHWARRWGSSSRRLRWLAVTLAVAEKPARSADPTLPSRVAAWLTQLMERAPPSTHLDQTLIAVQEQWTTETLEERRTTETPEEQNTIETRGSPATSNVAPSGPNESFETEVAAVTVANAVELGSESAGRSKGTESSEFAGLLFLVPILERLGFAEMLVAQPALIECDFPIRLLGFIGRRVGFGLGDPLAAVLNVSDSPTPLPETWQMPEVARHELDIPKPRKPLDSPLLAWLTASRRWCRRHARMGLISLICRRGDVAISRTHLDILFTPGEADIRLRRLAVDVDPGWVPWIGRVVQFHYCETNE